MKPAPALRVDDEPAGAGRLRRRVRVDPAAIALGALLLATAAAKLAFAASHPLGFDELWTGMIASQRSLGGFVRQCYLDVNAPLSYAVTWIWARFAGLSDDALRFPSVVFASAAPLLALTPNSAIPRQARLVWAALLACWIPGFVFAAEARSYALLLFTGAGSTVAYLALLEKPSIRTALVWTTASSLLILTHYLALPLVACQGLGYLLVHRLRAVRTWPALAAFLPAQASLVAHAALLLRFTGQGPAGASPLPPGELPQLIAFLVGGGPSAWILLAWAVVAIALWRLKRGAASPTGDAPSLVWIAPATSLAATILCLAVSLAHPLIIDRYLTPMVPGVLLGIALVASKLGGRWTIAPAVLAALQFGLVVGLLPAAFHPNSRLRLEEAWSDLGAAGVQRLAFFWDSPTAAGGNTDSLAQIGGFFFRRAGRPLPVTGLILKPGEDPNPILALGDRRAGAGIVWLSQGAAGAAARRYPPRLERIDPAWRCRDYGTRPQLVIACIRRAAG
ncbi:MAG TPA: hypothetical protein VH353_11380 [Caulobacteraceae bacterium]|jgi:hypothetical protein|nr:hypothetical protein [Caulobacteraceae bacterium]